MFGAFSIWSELHIGVHTSMSPWFTLQDPPSPRPREGEERANRTIS